MTDNSPAMGNEWLLTEGTSTSVSWGSNCSGNGYGFSFGDASFYGSEEGVKMTYPSWPWGQVITRKTTESTKTEFDASRDLIEANELMEAGLTPEIVCLCGSTRFMDAFQQANKDLSLAGKIVLTVALVTSDATNSEVTVEQKVKLEVLHRQKIALADSIYVLNVGGYIGESTRSEIEYAKSLGKPVVYLEKKESNQ